MKRERGMSTFQNDSHVPAALPKKEKKEGKEGRKRKEERFWLLNR